MENHDPQIIVAIRSVNMEGPANAGPSIFINNTDKMVIPSSGRAAVLPMLETRLCCYLFSGDCLQQN